MTTSPTLPDLEAAHECRIEQSCARLGLRLTGQRRLIARILSAADDHPSADEVFRRAALIEPQIALSTVYRTVKLFADHGLLERHEFGGQQPRARFEAAPFEHHDHLIDTDTGEVIEFRSEAIEALQDAIARELGYRLVGHRLQLYGVRVAGPQGTANE